MRTEFLVCNKIEKRKVQQTHPRIWSAPLLFAQPLLARVQASIAEPQHDKTNNMTH